MVSAYSAAATVAPLLLDTPDHCSYISMENIIPCRVVVAAVAKETLIRARQENSQWQHHILHQTKSWSNESVKTPALRIRLRIKGKIAGSDSQ